MITALASAALLTLGVAQAAPELSSHPFHRSYAEVDHNQERKELQIALTMVGYDLEEALSRREGKRVSIDQSERVHGLIEDYLAERFVVTLADGTRPGVRFFGHEDEGKAIWLYFTVSVAGQDSESPEPTAKKAASPFVGMQLENRVLMEMNSEQRNTVEARDGRWRELFEFTPKQTKRVLREPAPKPKPTPKPAQKAPTREL